LLEFVENLRGRVTHPLTISSWLISSLLISLSGPFATFGTTSPTLSMVYWSGLIGTAIVVATAVCEIVKNITKESRTHGRDLRVSLTFALIYGPMFWLFVHKMTAEHDPIHFPLWQTTLYIAVLCYGILYIRRIVGVGDEPVVIHPRLAQRLGGLKNAKIARISGRDHYVDIHLTSGDVRPVLMRFSDAIDELQGVEGVRVHRSHWVAKRAVVGVAREKGRLFLVTSDSARVPVSRGFRGHAQQAGLI